MLTRSCWNILRELFSTYLTGYGLLYPVLDVNNCPPPPQKIFMGPELLSVDYRWSAPIWIPADSNAWGVADLKGTGINTIRIVLYHVKTGLPPSFRFILIPTVNKINRSLLDSLICCCNVGPSPKWAETTIQWSYDKTLRNCPITPSRSLHAFQDWV